MAIKEDDVILFQGDSITDAGRHRRATGANDAGALGRGYAFLAAARLRADHPDKKLKIYNRGVSGNKVFQLQERWKADCLDLKPNILSILIGVNDIWHKLNGNYDGDVKKYEDDYHTLLDESRREFPELTLVICEPFVLRTGAVTDKWFPEFDAFRAAAARQAKIFNATFIPFHSMFDELTRQAEPAYWAGDGVHPTPAGHQKMADAWVKAVG